MTKSSSLPPHDIESEQAILGAILMDNASLPAVEDAGIMADDFYHSAHQFLFNAILDIKEEGSVIDLVTVCARLKDLRKLDVCGGMVYIAGLPENTPSSANVIHYCTIVKEKSLRRQLLKKSFDLATQSQDVSNSVIDVINQYQKGLGIEEPRKINKFDIRHAISDLQTKIDQGFPGIDPSYDILRKTIRKFVPGTLIIVGAYTSVGKSAFAVDLISRLYRNGNPAIAIFSLEMSTNQYLLRLLANQTAYPTWAIRENRIMPGTQREMLDHAYSHFKSKPLHIYDNLYNFNDIRKAAAETKLNKGLDILIIDYIQNVWCDGRTIYERMSGLSTQVFALAKDLEITVIALSQINNESARDSDNPVIGYKGAGEIAAAADVGIWLDKDPNKEDHLIIKVRKNRDGRTMEGVLKYAHGYTRLVEITENEENGG
jgi:replicative DNA helicase